MFWFNFFLLQNGFFFFIGLIILISFSLNRFTFCQDNLCLVIKLITAPIALQELGNILTALLTNTKDQSEHWNPPKRSFPNISWNWHHHYHCKCQWQNKTLEQLQYRVSLAPEKVRGPGSRRQLNFTSSKLTGFGNFENFPSWSQHNSEVYTYCYVGDRWIDLWLSHSLSRGNQ